MIHAIEKRLNVAVRHEDVTEFATLTDPGYSPVHGPARSVTEAAFQKLLLKRAGEVMRNRGLKHPVAHGGHQQSASGASLWTFLDYDLQERERAIQPGVYTLTQLWQMTVNPVSELAHRDAISPRATLVCLYTFPGFPELFICEREGHNVLNL